MIKIQPTAQDWIDAHRLGIRWSANNWLFRAGGGGMIASAGVLIVANKSLPEYFEGFGVLMIVLPVSFWMFVPLLQQLHLPVWCKHLFKQTKAAGKLTEMVWDDTAITFSTESSHDQLHWQDFVGWRRNAKVLILYINDLQFHIIPMRAFVDEAARGAFVRLVSEKVPRK
jgi:hypothetical protein